MITKRALIRTTPTINKYLSIIFLPRTFNRIKDLKYNSSHQNVVHLMFRMIKSQCYIRSLTLTNNSHLINNIIISDDHPYRSSNVLQLLDIGIHEIRYPKTQNRKYKRLECEARQALSFIMFIFIYCNGGNIHGPFCPNFTRKLD